MAGLIQQEMGGAPANGAPPQDQMPPAQQGGQMPMDDEASEADAPGEDDPAFQQALTYAYEVLYKNEAAKDIAKQIKAAPSVAEGMADIAYNITSIIDEKTNGDVPDEMLIPLAMNVLEEVGEIAGAAGMEPAPEDVAAAFKTMILRYLQDQGMDTSQLQQAMDKVDPSVFRQAAEQED